MKNLIITIMMLVSFQGLAGQDGGGGGVIIRNGQYLTFGSAGMKIKLSGPQGMEQVPSMDLLLAVLDANQRGMDNQFQGQLVQAILPSESRRYFRIDVGQMDSNTYASLIEEYSKLLHGEIDPKNLALAAITIKEDTFLLPPFFQLKSAEQAAILFHESLWLVKPDIQYDELVNAEITMQKHIEKHGTNSAYNPELVWVIGRIFNSPALAVKAALIEDLRVGVFKKYKLNARRDYKGFTIYDLVKIFGEEKLAELNYSKERKGKYVVLVRAASQAYPESKFFKMLFLTRDNTTRLEFSSMSANPAMLEIENGCLVSIENRRYKGGLFYDDDGGSEYKTESKICFR